MNDISLYVVYELSIMYDNLNIMQSFNTDCLYWRAVTEVYDTETKLIFTFTGNNRIPNIV